MLAPLFLVAVLWGCTNPFIKRGSAGLEQLRRSSQYKRSGRLAATWLEVKHLASTRAYLIPLVINLSGSLLYFASLGGSSTCHHHLGPR